jgi:ABC-type branched-subunit amino acid transport system substrate-binding protein
MNSTEGRPGSDGLTACQRRGKTIYMEGVSARGGEITATLGESRDAVSASLFACANCHGRDGRGRPEGGIDPPDITWRSLVRPRSDQGERRRARPAYQPASLGRVISMGVGSSGDRTGVGMPIYQLSTADLDDLIAYLQVLGTEPGPGVSSSSLRIGTLLPPPGAADALRESIAATLRAAVADLNERGGIYRRHIELELHDLWDSPAVAGNSVSSFLERRSIFALVAPYIAGAEEEVARAVRKEGVPMIGPFSPVGLLDDSNAREIFFVEPNLTAQAVALIRGRLGQTVAEAPAIVRGDDPSLARVADEATEHWRALLGVDPSRFVLRPGATADDLDRLVADLARLKCDVVLYLGPSTLARTLIQTGDRASWHPRFYTPSAFWSRGLDELPPAFRGRILLAFPRLPEDVTRAGRDFLERLRTHHGLSREHEATQLAVLTAFRVLEEGLRHSGSQPTQAGLIDELNRLEDFETGLSRPLTFGPLRRRGIRGAYLLTLDPEAARFRPVGWVDAEGPR